MNITDQDSVSIHVLGVSPQFSDSGKQCFYGVDITSLKNDRKISNPQFSKIENNTMRNIERKMYNEFSANSYKRVLKQKENICVNSNESLKENKLHNKGLNSAQEKVNDYNKFIKSNVNIEEGKLVKRLEKELADIIQVFEKERADKDKEIERLNIEIIRLNKVIDEHKGSISKDTKIKSLENLLQKIHKESLDAKGKVVKLYEIIKEKDKKINEFQNLLNEKISMNEAKSQSEIAYLKGIIQGNTKLINNAETRTTMENSLKYRNNQLIHALENKNKEIRELKELIELNKMNNNPTAELYFKDVYQET